jgi:hypothetical protein
VQNVQVRIPHAPRRVNIPDGAPPAVLASFRESSGEERERLAAHRGYRLPEELARHAHTERFAPEELRGACREAGEGLGREDARDARFRTAAEMVALWEGLDLPAWVAPYALRDARLGYLNGYESALVSGELSESQTARAAESRWGDGWREKLAAARERASER